MTLSDLIWESVFICFGMWLGSASGSRIGFWVGLIIGFGLLPLVCSLNLRRYFRLLASEAEKSKAKDEFKVYRFDSSWEGDGQVFDHREDKPLCRYKSLGGNPFRRSSYGFFRLPPFVVQDLEGRELVAFNRVARFPFSVFEVTEGSRVIGMVHQRSLYMSLLSTKYLLAFESGLRCTFCMPRLTVCFLGKTESGGQILVESRAHRVWMVGIDRSIDSLPLVAAIAFIHRERLRHG